MSHHFNDIQIRPLAGLTRQELDRINQGYTSLTRYAVQKIETLQHTTITIELQKLGVPYIKRWESDDEELKRYQGIAVMGYSLGAYAGQKLVGLALAEPHWWNWSVLVWEFHVEPEYRRQGIGSQLMDSLAEASRGKGFRVLVCETQNTNVPAILFYRSTGFEIDGIDLSYYTNTDMIDGEVAIFMKMKL